MDNFWEGFNYGATGWFFMWTLLVVAAFMIAVTIERFIYIFSVSKINVPLFMAQIRKAVTARDYKKAITYCSAVKDKALPQVVLAGLLKASKMSTPDFRSVQNAVDESTLEIIPKLQARTNYLALIGNIATLIGLLGTIFGLMEAFEAVSEGVAKGALEAGQGSEQLTRGIATAMNTTFLGLAVAIPAISFYTIIHNKTNQIIDEIDEHLVKLINLITREKD